MQRAHNAVRHWRSNTAHYEQKQSKGWTHTTREHDLCCHTLRQANQHACAESCITYHTRHNGLIVVLWCCCCLLCSRCLLLVSHGQRWQTEALHLDLHLHLSSLCALSEPLPLLYDTLGDDPASAAAKMGSRHPLSFISVSASCTSSFNASRSLDKQVSTCGVECVFFWGGGGDGGSSRCRLHARFGWFSVGVCVTNPACSRDENSVTSGYRNDSLSVSHRRVPHTHTNKPCAF